MILTDGPKMVLTPTYHVFRMYLPFQDATFVPVSFDAGRYRRGDVELPRVDAVAARATDGKLWLALVNVDPNAASEIRVAVPGLSVRRAEGQVLTAANVNSVNTFEAPDTVTPKPITGRIEHGAVTVRLPARSVAMLSLER
jgi:alpha-N-arabinofuranosidase